MSLIETPLPPSRRPHSPACLDERGKLPSVEHAASTLGCRVLAERRQLPRHRIFDIGGPPVTPDAVCACSEQMTSASVWLPTTLSGGQSLPGQFRQSQSRPQVQARRQTARSGNELRRERRTRCLLSRAGEGAGRRCGAFLRAFERAAKRWRGFPVAKRAAADANRGCGLSCVIPRPSSLPARFCFRVRSRRRRRS